MAHRLPDTGGNMKRIIVLGSRGMLGHMVYRFLSKHDLDVITFNERWTPENQTGLSVRLAQMKPDACINAVGVREEPNTNHDMLLWINGTLPGLISRGLPADCHLIHASSDAVFASTKQGCRWDESCNPDTEYGRSKHLGELGLTRRNDWIIRTSIIGPEPSSQKSLMSWYLRQRKPVKGYTNQLWNGITTLEWARQSLNIIAENITRNEHILQPGIHPPVSKYDLLKLISRTFNHSVAVHPATSDFPVQRFLTPNVECPSLEEQLIQLAAFD